MKYTIKEGKYVNWRVFQIVVSAKEKKKNEKDQDNIKPSTSICYNPFREGVATRAKHIPKRKKKFCSGR